MDKKYGWGATCMHALDGLDLFPCLSVWLSLVRFDAFIKNCFTCHILRFCHTYISPPHIDHPFMHAAPFASHYIILSFVPLTLLLIFFFFVHFYAFFFKVFSLCMPVFYAFSFVMTAMTFF